MLEVMIKFSVWYNIHFGILLILNKEIIIMRKTILLSLLSIIGVANAQTNKAPIVNQCEQLKKENDSLKKVLGLNEPLVKYTKNEVEYQITKVSGDKKSQIVSIDIILVNKIENRVFEMQNMMGNSIKIITLNGDALFSNEQFVPGATMVSSSTILHTDTPLKMTFKFGPLLPSDEYIKLFFLGYKLRNLQDYKKDINEEIEFKDFKIIWK